ncbi:MAG: Hpt domain-containing protein [Gammaproteobacteria bacterium]
MNARTTMASPAISEPAAGEDLSALSWVHDELRRSLEAAHKALGRYLRESDSTYASDLDAVDPAVLRQARAQLHQAVGALELVGLPPASTLLRASEAAVQRMIAKPTQVDLHAVEVIERASFALLDYVARKLAGKPVAALALFPQYRAVQALAGADRVHPADLWDRAVAPAELPGDAEVAPRDADEALRVDVEAQMLSLLRHPRGPAAGHMSELFAALGNGAAARDGDATLWRLAAAFFEGQAHGLLPADVYVKRMAARLLAQLRLGARVPAADAAAGAERLRHDLLFFCAQAGLAGDTPATPRLAAARRAFGLFGHASTDYEAASLGRYDPAWLAQARKRVTAAKDAWSAVAAGEMHRAASLSESFALVADSLRRLFPQGEVLGEALQRAVADTQQRGTAPSPALAMEVATGMLWVEAVFDDAEFDHPEQATRVRRLAQRIAAVHAGQPVGALDGWMEELYRRVSDRQTIGSVVHELRAALAEAEKAIDPYFRDPAQRDSLVPVPGQLQTMRGVLSVLGLDQASHAVLRMRDDVDALLAADDGDREARIDRLAANLGALGFLVDMLGVQPALAKALFAFDADAGLLRSRVGAAVGAPAEAQSEPAGDLLERAGALAAAARDPQCDDDELRRRLESMAQQALVADQGALADAASRARAALARAGDDDARRQAREQLARSIDDLVAAASAPPVETPAAAPVPPPAVAGPGQTGLEGDAEVRAIFIDEAREVIAHARDALAALAEAPDDLAGMTAVRRAFHTLKGSSRMVGLAEFGEAAWACEQLYNTRLADAPRADDDLLGFSTEALDHLQGWVDAVADGRDAGHRPAAVQAAADALRLHGRREPLAPAVAEVALQAAVPGLPDAEALELPPPAQVPQAQPVEAAAHMPPAEVMLDVPPEWGTLSLDLGLDLGPGLGESLEAAPLPDLAAAPVAGATPDAPASAVAEPAPAFDAGLATPAGGAAAPALELDLGAFDAAGAPTPAADVVDLPDAEAQAPVDAEPTAAAFAPMPADGGPLPGEPAVPAAVSADAGAIELPAADAEQFKTVGPLRISIPLFNIYLNEADELSRRLVTEIAEWTHELHRPIGEPAIALAHSLAGSSATVGYHDLSNLARALEHALMRSQAIGRGDVDESALFGEVAEEIRRLLHQFAAGFLPAVPPVLFERLAAHEVDADARRRAVATRADAVAAAGQTGADEADEGVDPATLSGAVEAFALDVVEDDAGGFVEAIDGAGVDAAFATVAASQTPAADAGDAGAIEVALTETLPEDSAAAEAAPVLLGASPLALDSEDDIDVEDAVDAELFPIFEEEAQELLPQLASRLREWVRRPADAGAAAACMRTLHTLKGGARLAGAMRLGELAHRLETAIEHLLARGDVHVADVEALQSRGDTLGTVFEALRGGTTPAEPIAPAAPLRAEPIAVDAQAPAVAPTPAAPSAIDWSHFLHASVPVGAAPSEASAAVAGAVRVRVPLLDRLVNHAGEVSITRSRIEADVGQLKTSLVDLTDNLERLRRQLRDLELQAETQIASRMEQAKAAAQDFDPLEFDRFTRFQELTRMMAESVNDVATVQRSLQRALQSAEDDLAAQARLTRDLQDDLLRTRMVEFESLAERLYRVVRQAAKETGKQVRLDIVGGSIEVDRGVLDRMTPAFEHLLRNCVTHGVESPERRAAAGKDTAGQITVTLTHEGNEVGIEFRDDGGGLDLARIRARGEALGLIAPGAPAADDAIAQLIFTPGFSTAEQVTELAGRGVGMDVVRSDVVAMGGRIETATAAGQGTRFKLVLPLTTAVTQVVMLRCADTRVAVPSTLVDAVRRVPAELVESACVDGEIELGGERLPFYWLGALLHTGARSAARGRHATLVVVRSAQQRVVLHVDEVLGNQEAVVKNLGPQLSRLPGLAGMTLLASGAPALIYNPVALAAVYGEGAHARMRAAALAAPEVPADAAPVERAPLVLVVDDSLTVRRVTQRLLVREGYRVALAKDGLEALERLAEEKPAVVLSDIEMPRMDGFDLVRNLRGDARWRGLPVIMITSRIAQKHRDVAAELGVDHYLGKPYAEEDLLALVARHVAAPVAA